MEFVSEHPIRTLLCTVGNSLLGYLKKAGIENSEDSERAILEYLSNQDPFDIKSGAEVNTIAQILNLGHRGVYPELKQIDRIVFIVSDTPSGQLFGNVLSQHFNSSFSIQPIGNPIKSADFKIAVGLDPEDSLRFVTDGLSSVINIICDVWENERIDSRGIAIDATGGFKAQIAIATLLGQLLGVPVLYKYERFNRVERLIPFPIAFNVEAWQRHALDLEKLYKSGGLDAAELPDWFDAANSALGPLLETIKEGDTHHVSLSITGRVFHSALRKKYPISASIPHSRAAGFEPQVIWEKKEYGQSEHAEAKKLVNKLIKACPYITRVNFHWRSPAADFKTEAKITPEKRGDKSVEGVELIIGRGGKTSKAFLGFTKTVLTRPELEKICEDINEKLKNL